MLMDVERPRRFARIPTACREQEIGRAKLYQVAAVHAGLFRKLGRAVYVDMHMLEKIIAQSPQAVISPPAVGNDTPPEAA